ncbi:MAG: YfiR family protein [Sterolibacterium sp.]|nr:YfiR family protein [Sterolibacterium sp.]
MYTASAVVADHAARRGPGPVLRRYLSALPALIAATVLGIISAPAAAQVHDEELMLQAVFIGRLASYVEGSNWPVSTHENFVITVLRPDPFGELLDTLYRDKRIHGKPVEIRHAASLERLGSTDVLVVGAGTYRARHEAITYAQQNGILTIGLVPGFAAQGGIMQLNFVEQKARITINHEIALRNGLKIGAPLLSIAKVLRKEGP